MFIYSVPVIGKRLLGYVVKKEGGAQESDTLRAVTKKRYKVDVGKYTYGGCFSPSFNYNIGGEVVIGRYCSFASDIHYFAANHPMDRFSTSPYFFRKEWGFNVDDVERSTLTIGHDVWVGFGVLITSGCKHIGNGAVIAAGTVLTEDVPAYSVIGGVPGKQIKKRFSQETMELLDKSKWWELSPAEVYSLQKEHANIPSFARAVVDYKVKKNGERNEI